MIATPPTTFETAIREAIGSASRMDAAGYHKAMVNYLNRRAAFCVEVATNVSDVAAHALTAYHDGFIAADLMAAAGDFFDEFKLVDAMRVRPVLTS